MQHFRQWERKALGLCSPLQTGSVEPPLQITGSMYGSCSDGGHFTSTIAFTLIIPVRQKKYSLDGGLSGKTFLTKSSKGVVSIYGYVKTELITLKGRVCCKLTRREYTSRLQPTLVATVGAVKISILATETPHTTLHAGGGVLERA